MIITPIIIAVVAFIFVYRYYNHQDKETTLTVSEKKWVQENKSKTRFLKDFVYCQIHM